MLALEDRRHYTYAHARKTTGEIFYLGKGSNGRAFELKARGAWHMRVATQHGVDVHILAQHLTAREAYGHERQLIAEARELGLNIVNMSDGGEGNDGYRHSDETKLAISLVHKGKLVSAETRQKLSAKFLGRPISDAQKKAISSTLSGKKCPWVSESNKKRKGLSQSGTIVVKRTAAVRKTMSTPEYRAAARLRALAREAKKRNLSTTQE
jgi:hypothetical protein